MRVALRYFIIFEPSETWQSEIQFNDDLAAYFKSFGYSIEDISMSNKDPNMGTLIYLEKDEDPILVSAPKGVSLKQEIAQQTQKRGFDGKFKKGDGR